MQIVPLDITTGIWIGSLNYPNIGISNIYAIQPGYAFIYHNPNTGISPYPENLGWTLSQFNTNATPAFSSLVFEKINDPNLTVWEDQYPFTDSSRKAYTTRSFVYNQEHSFLSNLNVYNGLPKYDKLLLQPTGSYVSSGLKTVDIVATPGLASDTTGSGAYNYLGFPDSARIFPMPPNTTEYNNFLKQNSGIREYTTLNYSYNKAGKIGNEIIDSGTYFQPTGSITIKKYNTIEAYASATNNFTYAYSEYKFSGSLIGPDPTNGIFPSPVSPTVTTSTTTSTTSTTSTTTSTTSTTTTTTPAP